MPFYTEWVVPACYKVVGTEEPLQQDLLMHAQRLLQQNVWERGFGYSFLPALEDLDSRAVLKASVAINGNDSFEHRSVEDISGYLARIFDDEAERNEVLRECRLDVGSCLVELTLELDERLIPEKRAAETVAMALIGELGGLFRAGLHLSTWAFNPVLPPWDHNPGGGGLLLMVSDEASEWLPRHSTEYTFPAEIEASSWSVIGDLTQLLALFWHLPLWPIHRYLKALSAESVQLENFLDLLFALEGLFPKNTSSDTVRLCTVLLGESDLGSAKRLDELLRMAFRMRNEIAHDAKSYSGLEAIQLHGEERPVMEVFWGLRLVVAKMIGVAFRKLMQNPDMRCLRVGTSDVIEEVLRKKSS